MTTTKSLEVARKMLEETVGPIYTGAHAMTAGQVLPIIAKLIEAQAPKVSEGKKWPSREEFLAPFPFNTTYSYGTAAMCYDVLTAHAMPEMCVEASGFPSEEESEEARLLWVENMGRALGKDLKEIESQKHVIGTFPWKACDEFYRSRLKLRSVSEVRESERARSEKALEVLRYLWSPDNRDPNIYTAMDMAREALAEYEAGKEGSKT